MLLTLPFLALVGLVLPALAWMSHRALRAEAPPELPSARAMAWQTVIVQLLVAGTALLAAHGAELEVAWSSRLEPIALAAAIGIVALASALAWIESRKPPEPGQELLARLRALSPRGPAGVAVMTLAAGSEELAYRGVFFGLLEGPLGAAGAAGAGAVVFGLGHLVQGWRGAAYSAAFSLAMQGLVALSGGLALAMLVHLAYDLFAVALGRKLAPAEHEPAG